VKEQDTQTKKRAFTLAVDAEASAAALGAKDAPSLMNAHPRLARLLNLLLMLAVIQMCPMTHSDVSHDSFMTH